MSEGIETVEPRGSVPASGSHADAPPKPLLQEYENVIAGQSIPDCAGPKPNASKERDFTNLTAVLQIPVEVKAVLGETTIPIATLMKLRRGSVLSLNRRVGETIEITVNGRVVARGEVVIVEDGVPHLGISLTEVIGRSSTIQDISTMDLSPGQPR